ncbi:uncharacterized protein PADG_04711 [Paracoccidioides brasiliensis Pb18]|uniref:Glycosyl hydrolase family 92 domain-containing protein n=1 Tax=Paracoccidioides brasiliensis (strain Pb18) TaxID=502780 RepID=C1GCI9_PARBD|nr:uncharacterized protein PADG_04711 [Paracoccidioides brasiliensis Pb18]EEH48632.2 hypothetical protein PADG_04711 [Paracoccidioides brasiliensis Pb18]
MTVTDCAYDALSFSPFPGLPLRQVRSPKANVVLLDLTDLNDSRQNPSIKVGEDGRITGNGTFIPSFGGGSYVSHFYKLSAMVRVSFLSAEQACANAENEIPGPAWDFVLVKHNAEDAWGEEISSITVRFGGVNKDLLTTFWSVIYRTPIRLLGGCRLFNDWMWGMNGERHDLMSI